MCTLGITTGVAGALAAAVISLGAGLSAPAAAAPSGPGNAQDTISQLEREGYRVIVNRIGGTPLEHATVIAIRPGQTYRRIDTGVPGAGGDLTTTVTGRTVYVDVR